MPADLRMKPESLKLVAHAAFFIVQLSFFLCCPSRQPCSRVRWSWLGSDVTRSQPQLIEVVMLRLWHLALPLLFLSQLPPFQEVQIQMLAEPLHVLKLQPCIV